MHAALTEKVVGVFDEAEIIDHVAECSQDKLSRYQARRRLEAGERVYTFFAYYTAMWEEGL